MIRIKTVTAEVIEALKSKWNDETLEKIDDMYGEQWPRSLTAW